MTVPTLYLRIWLQIGKESQFIDAYLANIVFGNVIVRM